MKETVAACATCAQILCWSLWKPVGRALGGACATSAALARRDADRVEWGAHARAGRLGADWLFVLPRRCVRATVLLDTAPGGRVGEPWAARGPSADQSRIFPLAIRNLGAGRPLNGMPGRAWTRCSRSGHTESRIRCKLPVKNARSSATARTCARG